MIHRPGDYSFTLKVDGVQLARYPISVIQLAGSNPRLPPRSYIGVIDSWHWTLERSRASTGTATIILTATSHTASRPIIWSIP